MSQQPQPRVRQVQITFDCAEPEHVARFWCEALGYVIPAPPPGFETWDAFQAVLPPEAQGSRFACEDPTGAGPRLFFQRVPETKTVKNRVHLDIRFAPGVTGNDRIVALETEAERLVALGATRVRLEDGEFGGEPCMVMQDVEGNEFCID